MGYGRYLAVVGGCTGRTNRRRGNIGQRFASDWIKFGEDGTPFHGDSTVNANWYGYGVAVVAGAKGKVVEVKDGIKENVPFPPTMAVPTTLETVGGNHIQ